jgi:hypothetical protein
LVEVNAKKKKKKKRKKKRKKKKKKMGKKEKIRRWMDAAVESLWTRVAT